MRTTEEIKGFIEDQKTLFINSTGPFDIVGITRCDAAFHVLENLLNFINQEEPKNDSTK